MAQLLYFGKLSDFTGSLSETISLPATVTDTSSLRAWLSTHRGFGAAILDETVRIAINDEIVTEPSSIAAGDTIAFMPPVGGG